jgi:O-antigen ligase
MNSLTRGDGPALASLGLLMLAAAYQRLAFDVAGLTVYPEYLALAVLAAGAALAVWRGALRWQWPPATWPLLGWLAVALLASLVNAPNPLHSAVLWVKLALMVTAFVLVANLARGRVRAAIMLQVAVGAFVALHTLLAQVLWSLAGVNVGMNWAAGGTHVPVAGLWEPNILGSYLLAAVVLALGLAVQRDLARAERALAVTTAVLGLPALVLSVTRAAWVALAVVLVLAALIEAARRPRLALRVGGAAFVTIAVVAAALWLLRINPFAWLPEYDPLRNGSVIQRLASFGALERDGNLWVRSEVIRNALVVWEHRPLIGWGVGAYGDMFVYPNQNVPAWVPNLFVHHLFDAGWLGLVLFLSGIGLVAGAALGLWAWYRRRGLASGVFGPLLLALLGLLIAFQTTEATWFAYPWIYLGLLQAAVAGDVAE